MDGQLRTSSLPSRAPRRDRDRTGLLRASSQQQVRSVVFRAVHSRSARQRVGPHALPPVRRARRGVRRRHRGQYRIALFLRLLLALRHRQAGIDRPVHVAGILVARYPVRESVIGAEGSSDRLFTQHLRNASAGSYSYRSAVDGVERLSGYRRGDMFPVVVLAAVGRAESLADWYQRFHLSNHRHQRFLSR